MSDFERRKQSVRERFRTATVAQKKEMLLIATSFLANLLDRDEEREQLDMEVWGSLFDSQPSNSDGDNE